MASRWENLVVGAADPARLARWWAEVLGYSIIRENTQEVDISGPNGGPRLSFVSVTGPKTTKNRLYLDLRPDDRDAEVERLVNMGARRIGGGLRGDAVPVLLADPEGNEFCLLRTPN